MRRSLRSLVTLAALGVLSPAQAGPSTASSQKPAAAVPPAKPVVVAAAAKAPAKAPPKKVAAVLKAAWAPPAYVAMSKKWHEPSGEAPKTASGRPKLVLYAINRGDRLALEPSSDRGDFSPMELEKASFFLRSSDGQQHPVDPHVLDIAYALQRHFGSGEVRFLSGYRTPKKSGSNHGFGRAIDLVIPGATDDEVATYARTLGFVGVGIYPTSGFVHVDVRDRSFFWSDRSGPGKPNKTVGILHDEAAADDDKAKKLGKLGTPSTHIGRDVDGALAIRAKAVASGAAFADAEEPYGDEDDH